ncbi:MAG: KR domain-containing protein [Henriciella sp.]|nr:KR domain-containing protein [Henriciella sp.]
MSGLAPIEITGADEAIAAAIAEALIGANVTASIVNQPSGNARTVILTEGLKSGDLIDRHWSVLAQSCLAQSGAAKIICLQHTATDFTEQTGLAGLARTLRKEWDTVETVCWAFEACEPGLSIRALSGGLGDAVVAGDGNWREQAIGSALQPPLIRNMDQGGVWLITGGARGVTASCTAELARRTGGTFILAGRSAQAAWPAGVARTTDIKALRAALAQQAKTVGEKIKLPDLDRMAHQALAGQEIGETIAAIEIAGGTAHYAQLDLSDDAAVRVQIMDLQTRFGQITGLVHGAGVLADRLALKKTRNDLATVFGPKVLGLQSVLGALDISALTHVALFSSASAAFGNVGQADYAIANTCLNQIANLLADQTPGLRAKAFNWGPWDGGMVDTSLAELFTAQGIGLIDRQDGARIFADQLLDGDPAEIELLVGDRWTVS